MNEITACWFLVILFQMAVATSAADRLTNLRQLQTSPVKHSVRLFISLEYLREEVSTSLESMLPDNPVVSHFCKAVNSQASGAQVQAYSKALSASIGTKIVSGDAVPDYECRIIGTNRITDEAGGHLFNDERVYVVEVAVQQTVYVSGELTSEQIAGIVESGFNRGDGGRIKFRSLLQENQGFNTLVNVEVLRELSSPFDETTVTPSTSPMESTSTLQPTSNKTSPPSDIPSVNPSTMPPSIYVSASPSEAPALTVSAMPTVTPFRPIKEVSNSRNTQPLILGAIAGGLATIVASCFFIFCVWFPFCRNKRQREGDSRNKNSSELNLSNRDTTIPETLHLDDDSRSLANTTVTLGEKSSKKTSTPKTMNAYSSDSFDETSIYTSTLPVTSPGSDRFYDSPDRRVIETVDEANEIEVDEDVSDDDRSSQKSFFWNEMVEESRSTKGLDVFSEDDESSYDFGGSIALSDPSFGPPGDVEREYRPTPSPSSTKTRRTMNLMSRRSSYVSDIDEEMKSESTEEISVLPAPNRLSTDISSQAHDNNTLLRAILENARNQQKIGSSKASLKSAPPRIHDLRQRSGDVRTSQAAKQSARLDEHLHKAQAHRHLPPKSTRSVGTYSTPIDYSLYKSTASLSGRLNPPVRSSQSSAGARRALNPYSLGGSNDGDAFKTAMVSPSSSDSLYGRSEKIGSRKCDAPGVLGIASIPKAESSVTGANEWGVECNVESLSVRSGANSAWSVRSVQSDGTFSTDASQSTSYASSKELAVSTETRSKISALQHDLERIGQLSSFSREGAASVASTGASRATYPTRSVPHGNRKQRVIVVAPPGKIGVVLINRHDGRGTIVSEVRSSSSVKGLLYAGDKLVAVDGRDVTGMDVREITSVMSNRADKERRLTIISSRDNGTSRWREESKETYSP